MLNEVTLSWDIPEQFKWNSILHWCKWLAMADIIACIHGYTLKSSLVCGYKGCYTHDIPLQLMYSLHKQTLWYTYLLNYQYSGQLGKDNCHILSCKLTASFKVVICDLCKIHVSFAVILPGESMHAPVCCSMPNVSW